MDNDPDIKKQNTNVCEKNLIADYTQILDPLLTQFKSLRQSVDNKVGSLEQAISQQRKVSEELHKIETRLTQQRAEITHELKSDILDNKRNISHIVQENKHLRRENIALKERLTQIESNQLKNNVIVTGILEQQWETYNSTKQRVQDTIVSALKSNNDEEREPNIATAQNTDITYCTCVGRY